MNIYKDWSGLKLANESAANMKSRTTYQQLTEKNIKRRSSFEHNSSRSVTLRRIRSRYQRECKPDAMKLADLNKPENIKDIRNQSQLISQTCMNSDREMSPTHDSNHRPFRVNKTKKLQFWPPVLGHVTSSYWLCNVL